MLWSSSFPETSSSLAEPRSSLVRPCSSMSDCRYSFVAASSCSSREARSSSGVARRRGALGRRFERLADGRGRVLEQHDEERLLDLRVAREREHHEVADARQPVLVDLHPVPPDGRLSFFAWATVARSAASSPGRAILMTSLCGSPGRGLQERSGLAAELEDLHPLVDEDARRGVAGQQHAVEVLGDVHPARGPRPRVGLRDRPVHPTRRRTGARSAGCSEAPCARRSCSSCRRPRTAGRTRRCSRCGRAAGSRAGSARSEGWE